MTIYAIQEAHMPQVTDVAWDLSDLFESIEDPRIESSLTDLLARSKKFAETYRGRINSPDLTAPTLLEALTELERIAVELTKLGSFAGLVFASDTSKFEHGAFLQMMQERQTEISMELMFFDLELMAAAPEVIGPVADDPALANYRHFIHAARLFRDYRLPEPEEKLLEEKANTGGRAFERLFEETTSSITYTVAVAGKRRKLTESEVLALLREPDRETRKSAAAALTRGLVGNGRLLTFIFNTLLQDKAVNDRLRGYEYPEQARHLSNELDRQTVDTVISVCVDNYDLVARYYRVKREILGYDTLTHYDRYAPLFESTREYSFDEARDIVLNSFGEFSDEMRAAAAAFFDNGWVDAQPRAGKRGGAFCMYVTPDLHPYVLLSYLNRKHDVMTLAHEMGHGVHAYLSRCQTHFNFHSVLPVAELASTFGEMLVFEKLAADSDVDEKLALYAEKIEDTFATVFRQAAMFRFEQELHRARREHGELPTERIGEMWQRAIQEMFGDSVELGKEHANWWMYVDHFVGSPFYVYAYSFGELLVMSLYSIYKREGSSFAPRFVELLKAGGSCSPSDLLAEVGIDIRDPEFWRGGVSVLEGLVENFERLYRQRG